MSMLGRSELECAIPKNFGDQPDDKLLLARDEGVTEILALRTTSNACSYRVVSAKCVLAQPPSNVGR